MNPKKEHDASFLDLNGSMPALFLIDYLTIWCQISDLASQNKILY